MTVVQTVDFVGDGDLGAVIVRESEQVLLLYRYGGCVDGSRCDDGGCGFFRFILFWLIYVFPGRCVGDDGMMFFLGFLGAGVDGVGEKGKWLLIGGRWGATGVEGLSRCCLWYGDDEGCLPGFAVPRGVSVLFFSRP